MMQDFAEIFQRFQHIRQTEGEEAFERAVREYAEKAFESGDDELIGRFAGAAYQEYAREAAAYRESVAEKAKAREARASQVRAPAVELDPSIVEALRNACPTMSQAQFNAFAAGFDALRTGMEAIFQHDLETEAKARQALTDALAAAKQVTEVTDRLRDVPEAATSKLADEFRQAPRQFTESEIQATLMSEIERIDSLGDLTRWWVENRERIDRVASKKLRDPLIDAVRGKKLLLSQVNSTET